MDSHIEWAGILVVLEALLDITPEADGWAAYVPRR
jgi:hypothetical protein